MLGLKAAVIECGFFVAKVLSNASLLTCALGHKLAVEETKACSSGGDAVRRHELHVRPAEELGVLHLPFLGRLGG